VVPDTAVYRTDRIPPAQTGGVSVAAAQLDLLPTVGAAVASGSWLNAATARYPAVVLGATAARRLGSVPAVYLGGRWFTVTGVLAPVPLAPELDSAVLVGWPAAADYLDFDGHPTTVYTRSDDAHVTAVRSVLAATANPESPDEVKVSRPSDALQARQATNRTFTQLLLGLGAVALLVGGIGVANTMYISVLERRREIGLRRALGANRGQVRLQFLTESMVLSLMGGAGGVLGGALATAAYCATQDWPFVLPTTTTVGGLVGTLVIGVLAGGYPAIRAARMHPTEALATV